MDKVEPVEKGIIGGLEDAMSNVTLAVDDLKAEMQSIKLRISEREKKVAQRERALNDREQTLIEREKGLNYREKSVECKKIEVETTMELKLDRRRQQLNKLSDRNKQELKMVEIGMVKLHEAIKDHQKKMRAAIDIYNTNAKGEWEDFLTKVLTEVESFRLPTATTLFRTNTAKLTGLYSEARQVGEECLKMMDKEV